MCGELAVKSQTDNVASEVEASELHFYWAVGQGMKWARHAMCVICLRRLVRWNDVSRQKLLVITLIEEERAKFSSC